MKYLILNEPGTHTGGYKFVVVRWGIALAYFRTSSDARAWCEEQAEF